MLPPINFEGIRKFILNNALICSLTAAALLAHYVTLFLYAENIPIGDDYYDVFRFLNRYENAPFIKEKLLAIYTQHNEHRTAFNRLIYLALYELTGSINFKILMLIGDLSTIGLITLLGIQYKTHKAAPIICAFIAIFLLNLQSWRSMLWAMTAISNYSVVFFTLACFAALSSDKTSLILTGALFASFASFSMGNGLLVWPLGLLCIALNKSSKRNSHALLWLLASAICIFIYFYNYTTSPAMKLSLGLTSPASHWLNAFKWFVSFLGACWTFESTNTTAAALAGTILLTAAIPCCIGMMNKKPAIASLIAFILASAAITTYSRFGLWSPAEALSSRYKIYSVYLSCILLVSLFTWLAEKEIKTRWLSLCLLAIATLHTAISYATSLEPLRAEHSDASDSMRRWLLARQQVRFEFFFMPDGGIWIEDAVVSKRWDPRGLFSDSLYFNRNKSTGICAQTDFKGELPLEIVRHPQAEAGEIIIDDGSLIYDRIKHIIVCKHRRTYVADTTEPSRSINGKLVFHYLRIDPLESAESIIFEIGNKTLYKGRVRK